MHKINRKEISSGDRQSFRIRCLWIDHSNTLVLVVKCEVSMNFLSLLQLNQTTLVKEASKASTFRDRIVAFPFAGFFRAGVSVVPRVEIG